jgi:hypothetical protein
MKKSNQLITLITFITIFFIYSGISFADSTWTGSDTNGVASRNGSVGIGTTTPSAKLDVASNNFGAPASSGSTNIAFMRIGYNDGRIWGGNELNMGIINSSVSNYAFWLHAQSPSDLSITRPLLLNPNGGNVGIGSTNNPYAALHITREGIGTIELLRLDNPNLANVDKGGKISFYETSDYETGKIENTWTPSDSLWNFRLGVRGNLDAFTIKGNGNVGIGTTTPKEKLDVNGTIRANNNLIAMPWYNMATAPQGAWVPGYMKLKTPIVATGPDDMFSIRIRGYRYGLSGTPVDIICGGYAYPPAGLIQTGCNTEGTSDPVGIGVENGKVIITIGSGGGAWYYDHFTAEYSGWIQRSSSDFVWEFVYNTVPNTANLNNVIIKDKEGTIYTTGAVGIGTTTPGNYKLNVVGSVRANEVVVNTTGADYVFKDDYELKALEEVAEFIEKENHLPGIPSASEMQANGVGVSEIQSKLLSKIEELTLYLIEQNKQIAALKAKVIELEKNE